MILAKTNVIVVKFYNCKIDKILLFSNLNEQIFYRQDSGIKDVNFS